MKTVSIPVDNVTWHAAASVAEVQHTTLGDMLAVYVRNVAAQHGNGEKERRSLARKELVKALKECDAVVGETPTRERTYSDRRFHRH